MVRIRHDPSTRFQKESHRVNPQSSRPAPDRCSAWDDRLSTLVEDARTVVAMGGMLPADGLFYSARNSGVTVVRWKCDGSLAARVSV